MHYGHPTCRCSVYSCLLQHHILSLAIVNCKSLGFVTQLLFSIAIVTNAVVRCSFSEQLGIVDSLSSRQDLLSSHEHVIRVGVFLQEEHVGFVMNNAAFE